MLSYVFTASRVLVASSAGVNSTAAITLAVATLAGIAAAGIYSFVKNK